MSTASASGAGRLNDSELHAIRAAVADAIDCAAAGNMTGAMRDLSGPVGEALHFDVAPRRYLRQTPVEKMLENAERAALRLQAVIAELKRRQASA